jgi:hypothetical protein
MKLEMIIAALLAAGTVVAIAVPAELHEDGTLCWKKDRKDVPITEAQNYA